MEDISQELHEININVNESTKTDPVDQPPTEKSTFNNSLLPIFFAILIVSVFVGLSFIMSTSPLTAKCNLGNEYGNIDQYLQGNAVLNVIVLILLLLATRYFTSSYGLFHEILKPIVVLNVCFRLFWFITGAVIIFYGNIECMGQGISAYYYAIVVWSLEALLILITIISCIISCYHDCKTRI